MIRKSRWRSLKVVKQIHGRLVVQGLRSDLPALRDLLLSMPSIRGTMDYALKVFAEMPEPDLFTWNAMIRCVAHSSDHPSSAFLLHAEMKERCVRPDSFTFIFLLKACAKHSESSAGAQLHGIVVRLGLESDAYVRNALIHMHANCGDLDIAGALLRESSEKDVVACSALVAGYARRGLLYPARRLFDAAEMKDLVSWNIMISAYARYGDMDKARQLFDQAPEKDIVSWNAMIAGYVKIESHEQALRVYEEMQRAGERADEATVVSLLSSCAASGALKLGTRIHHSITEKSAGTSLSLLFGNALVDMYAKCGCINRATEVFRGMRERDIWTWNSIIGGLAIHGHAKETIQLFEEMRKERVKPDEITFVNVLTACSHGGMVKEGRRYFSVMRDEYDIEPSVKHYGCMVDMLGRIGLVEEAFELVGAMKTQPNSIIWKALLAACQAHGHVRLGEYASAQLRRTMKGASGDYVLLSNFCGSAGKWRGSEQVRQLMDANGVAKEAGRTLIEA